MEKIIVITLLFLNWNGDIKQESFEIFQSCEAWFTNNVKVHERKQRKVFSNHYYHTYEGKQVIGYICSDSIPQ